MIDTLKRVIRTSKIHPEQTCLLVSSESHISQHRKHPIHQLNCRVLFHYSKDVKHFEDDSNSSSSDEDDIERQLSLNDDLKKNVELWTSSSMDRLTIHHCSKQQPKGKQQQKTSQTSSDHDDIKHLLPINDDSKKNCGRRGSTSAAARRSSIHQYAQRQQQQQCKQKEKIGEISSKDDDIERQLSLNDDLKETCELWSSSFAEISLSIPDHRLQQQQEKQQDFEQETSESEGSIDIPFESDESSDSATMPNETPIFQYLIDEEDGDDDDDDDNDEDKNDDDDDDEDEDGDVDNNDDNDDDIDKLWTFTPTFPTDIKIEPNLSISEDEEDLDQHDEMDAFEPFQFEDDSFFPPFSSSPTQRLQDTSSPHYQVDSDRENLQIINAALRIQHTADEYFNSRRYNEAIDAYIEALQQYESLPTFQDQQRHKDQIFSILISLAQCYESNKNCEDAIQTYQEALLLLSCPTPDNNSSKQSPPPITTLAQIHTSIGYLHYLSNQYELSIHHYKIAFHYYSKTNDNKTIIASLFNNLGNAHHSNKEYNKAIRYYKQSLQNYLTGDDNDEGNNTTTITSNRHRHRRQCASVFNNIGNSRSCVHQYSKAKKAHCKALQMLALWKTPSTNEKYECVAQTLNFLGNVYCMERNWEESLKAHQAALNLYEKHDMIWTSANTVETLRKIGYVREMQMESDLALGAYERAYEIWRWRMRRGLECDDVEKMMGWVLYNKARMMEKELEDTKHLIEF